MGNFYVNYSIKCIDQKAVVTALTGRTALVSRPVGGYVVVLDEESDAQDQNVIRGLSALLSKKLGSPVLAVLNHDDDILWFILAEAGRSTDSYDSSPGYFDADAEPSAPVGGDARRICSAFGNGRVEEVEKILRKSSYDDDGYVFAVERHSDLVAALGLPTFTAGVGYRYASEGEWPEGVTASDFITVP